MCYAHSWLKKFTQIRTTKLVITCNIFCETWISDPLPSYMKNKVENWKCHHQPFSNPVFPYMVHWKFKPLVILQIIIKYKKRPLGSPQTGMMLPISSSPPSSFKLSVEMLHLPPSHVHDNHKWWNTLCGGGTVDLTWCTAYKRLIITLKQRKRIAHNFA
jgi:hypothetical protein